MRWKISQLGKGKDGYGLIPTDLNIGNIPHNLEAGFYIMDIDQCAFSWMAYDVTVKYQESLL